MDLMDRPSGNHGDWNESRNGSGPNSPDIYDRQLHPHPAHAMFNPSVLNLRPPHPGISPTNAPQTTNTNPNVSKPRIWSLADMASKENKDESTHSSTNNGNSYTASMHGKILSPLAARGLHPLHHPYMRPELYRNFYNPASAAHLAGNPHDAAILESYQRTFNATLAHNGSVPLSSVLKGSPFGPLSLTAVSAGNNNNNPPQAMIQAPRASSPASSTSSTQEHSTPERSLNLQTSVTPQTPVPINVTKP
jgi:hypothetical protein